LLTDLPPFLAEPGEVDANHAPTFSINGAGNPEQTVKEIAAVLRRGVRRGLFTLGYGREQGAARRRSTGPVRAGRT
jgi:hypothetical protein